MFKHPTTTGFRGPLTGTLLCLTLVPLLAPADPPAADTGGTDKTVFTESDSMLQQTAGTDYSVFGIAYVSDDQLLLDFQPSVPQEFPVMSVAVAYSKDTEFRGTSGSDELQAVARKKIRVRQKVVDWVKAKSPAAGAVTYLLVAKPDNGWHLAIDPGDEVMLEWNVTF
jgi:hypothetical protein